ncbi:MAG: methyl-accepting chemotaxis protein [Anaerobacillus sp.]|uniref:methyl-accepting chemotaxis protein n=1 Tax=Anaerobacillus sp. TaxID=1872506 RepID=UPI00391971F6
MKLTTLLKTTTVIIALLFILTGWTMFQLSKSLEKEKHAFNLQTELTMLSIELQDSSDYLTNEVRAYTQFGLSIHYNNYWKEVNETKTRDRVVARFNELQVPNELISLIELAAENSNDLILLEEQAMDLVEKGNLEMARTIVFGASYEVGKLLIAESIDEFNEKLEQWTNSIVSEAERDVNFSYFVMITSSILVFISLALAFFFIHIKLIPLGKLSKMAEQIAKGDLNVSSLKVKSKDEVAQLSRSFNIMADNLRNLIQTVKQASENLAASSEELLASAEQTNGATQQVCTSIDEIATGADVQLKQIQDSTVAINEVSNGIQTIANASSAVSKASEETTYKAQLGEGNITQAVTQMRTIENNVIITSKSIKALDERSKEIEKIVVAISDISNQTNLLALNAAIEAARAGEHGKGFAVVADEVRKLAEQSSKSATQITELIQSIQSDTLTTVDQMNTVSEDVLHGVSIIENTGQAFKEILDSAQSLASVVQEVTSITEEIAASTEQVASSFVDVNSITEQATSKTQMVAGLAEEQSASMEEITASAETLSKLASELSEEIGKFRL